MQAQEPRPRAPRHLVLIAAFALLGTACTLTFGEPAPSTKATASRAPDANGDAETAPTAPTGGDGAGTGTDTSTPSGGGGPRATRSGHVSITQTSTTVGAKTYEQWSAAAAFVDAPLGGYGSPTGGGSAGTTCQAHEDGPCVAYTCTVQSNGGDPSGGRATKQPHAGEIRLELAGGVITLAPREDGSYAAATGQTKLFGAAEPVKVRAAGDAVPAFEQSIVTPSAVTVTAPAWPALGQALSVRRGAPLDVAWTGGEAGVVYVSAGGLNAAGDRSASVACRFDGKAGRATIPGAVTDKLIPTSQGALSAFAHTSIMMKRGEFDLYLSINASARTPSGATASGLLRVE